MKISLVFPSTSMLLAITTTATYTDQSRLVGNISKTATCSNQTTRNWNATTAATFPDQSSLISDALLLTPSNELSPVVLMPETALVPVQTKPTVTLAVQAGSTSPPIVSTAAAPVATPLADPPSNAPHPGDNPTLDQSIYGSQFGDHQTSQAAPHTASLLAAVIAEPPPISPPSRGLVNVYAPPITIGPSMYSANAVLNYLIGSQTLLPGGSAITVSGIPVQILPSGNIILAGSASTSLQPFVLRSSNSPSTLTLNRIPITAEQLQGYIIASHTLLPGRPITANDVEIAVATDGAGSPQPVAGASTAKLVVADSPSPIVFNGMTLTPIITPAYTIAGQTSFQSGIVTNSSTKIALSTSQASQNVSVVGSNSSVSVDATVAGTSGKTGAAGWNRSLDARTLVSWLSFSGIVSLLPSTVF